MATFKLEGEDLPEEGAAQPNAPQPDTPKAPDEFSFFLNDDPKPAAPAAPAPQTPAAPVRPANAQPPSPAPGQSPSARPSAPTPPVNPPTQVVAPLPDASMVPGVTPPHGSSPAAPSGPNLMRPAQSRADKSQPPGINVPAAAADTPNLTQPDAASIAQNATPSDDFSSGLQNFGYSIAKVLDKGEDLFTWAARLAVPIAGLSLAYILAAVFTGNAANLDKNPNAAQLVHFLTLASLGLCWSLVVLAVSLLLLSYDDNRLGAFVAGCGVLLSFGFPILLRTLLGANYAVAQMIPIFLHVGRIVLFIGLFKAAIDIVVWTWNLPNKIKARQSVAGAVGFGKPVESKQQKLARNANMFSPCWKLPFCREPIRVLCPAFLARKTCWKFKRGCYCDEEMVGRIVRNEPLDVIKAANTRQSKEAPPCARCYIFLEHQTHEFRMMSPLAFPSTILLMFAGWPIYNTLFTALTKGYTSLFATLSFSVKAPDAIAASESGKAAAAASAISPEQIAQVSSYMLGGLLGFFLLIYISKFIEWAIFKAKW